MTSMTLNNPIPEPRGNILGVFSNLSAGWAKWSERRSVGSALDGLSDGQLSDIGLKVRSGIPTAAQAVWAA